MRMVLIDLETGLEEKNEDTLMIQAGLDPRIGYGGFGVDEDWIPLITSKCGSYGWLDCNKYEIRICLTANT